MAVEVASAYVTLLPSAKGFGKGISGQIGGDIDSAGREGGRRFGKGMSTGLAGIGSRIFAPLAAAAAGVGIASFFKEAVQGASDLNESSTKLQAVFGKSAAQVQKFAAGGAKALGQTQQQVLDAAATFGVFGKAAGKTGPDLAGFSTQLTTLSTDLASFYNTSPEQAAEAIAAGLRGESEPLRQYGVLLDDATLRQEALKQGLIKTTKQALTPQQKVLAAQAVIMKQTKDAQGDFARTSGGLANQQRILSAQFSDFRTTIGTALLPVMTKLVTLVNSKIVPAVMSFVSQVKAGTGVGGAFRSVLASVGGVLGTVAGFLVKNRDTLLPLVAAVVGAVGAFKAISSVARAYTAVQAALNFVLAANPIGIVVVAIAGLVAGLVVAYKRSDTFRKVVQGAMAGAVAAFRAVIDAASSVFGWLKSHWSLIVAVIIGPVGLAVRYVIQHWRQISDGAQAMASAVRTKLGELVGFFRELPGKILGAIGRVDDLLLGAGRSIIDGLLRGITEKFDAVKRKLGELTDKLPDWKGPASTDRVILRDAGRMVIGGFVGGMESQYGEVRSSLQGLTSSLRVAPEPYAPLTAGGVGATALPMHPRDRQLLEALANRDIVLDGRVVSQSVDSRIAGRVRL